MEKYKVSENNSAFFREMKEKGCTFDPKIESFMIPLSEKEIVKDSISFYFGNTKPLTPNQKRVRTHFSKKLPLDTYFRKTSEGLFLVDDKGLCTKKQVEDVAKAISVEILGVVGTTRYKLETSKSSLK